MMKRIISVFAAIILAACSMLTVVNAAASLNVIQGNVPAPGENFAVHVILSDSSGLKSLQCLISYDVNSAELVSCADGKYFDSFTQLPTDGGILLIWSSNADNDNYSTGILATITFKATSQPSNGSLITVTVLDAQNSSGSITVDGSSNIMLFDVDESDDDIISAEDGSEDDGYVAADDEEELEDEGDVVVGDEEEDDIVFADDEEEVTTASTTATKATTTAKKTSATTTTTEEKTSATTTATEEKTSATTTTANEEPPFENTPDTLDEPDPEVTSATPQSSGEQSVSFSGDAQTAAAQKKKANGGTVFAAVMIVGITVAAIAGIEIWKRGEEE